MTAILDRSVHGRHLGLRCSWLPSWMGVFVATILGRGIHDRHLGLQRS